MKRPITARQITSLCYAVVCLSVSLAFPLTTSAQNLPIDDARPIRIRADMDGSQPLTLVGAIELARRNYPAIKSASLKADAMREGITQAKTAYLPHVDLLLDENYGTANNITGFLAPQNIVPNISGLVRDSNNFQGGFGFTSGALISWEPFDLGLRKAQVNLARTATNQSQAQTAVTQLDVESHAADAFLSVLAAQQVVKAAQAKVDRFKVFLDSVHVLALKELKAKDGRISSRSRVG